MNIEKIIAGYNPTLKATLEFAQYWHGDQKRKYTGEPYWHHLVRVQQLVEPIDNEIHMWSMVALTHDVLEDTQCSAEDLWDFFEKFQVPLAPYVVRHVQDLTQEYTKDKYPEMNRFERKRAEHSLLQVASTLSIDVKYADIIDNVTGIVAQDPEFAKVYLEEKLHLLYKANHGNYKLWAAAITEIFVELKKAS